MWGIIPAAGAGSRIQPLAFSKELLPVGSRFDGTTERPKAVSEYLLERFLIAGADKICFVIAPGKSDILEYYGGGSFDSASAAFVVQPRPLGLCDALFRTAPFIAAGESVLIGLPDTIWFPEDGLRALGESMLEFLLFPVAHPEFFDAVITDSAGYVIEVEVKKPDARSHWIWGALKMPSTVMHELHALWIQRDHKDEFLGTLINAWIALGGRARGIKAGKSYVDVGTVHGYREAIRLLSTDASTIPELATAAV